MTESEKKKLRRAYRKAASAVIAAVTAVALESEQSRLLYAERDRALAAAIEEALTAALPAPESDNGAADAAYTSSPTATPSPTATSSPTATPSPTPDSPESSADLAELANKLLTAITAALEREDDELAVAAAVEAIMSRAAARRIAESAAAESRERSKRAIAEAENAENGEHYVKIWHAVRDKFTRASHAALDGERRELTEEFSNGLRYPCDEKGSAAEIANCRCYITVEPSPEPD